MTTRSTPLTDLSEAIRIGCAAAGDAEPASATEAGWQALLERMRAAGLPVPVVEETQELGPIAIEASASDDGGFTALAEWRWFTDGDAHIERPTLRVGRDGRVDLWLPLPLASSIRRVRLRSAATSFPLAFIGAPEAAERAALNVRRVSASPSATPRHAHGQIPPDVAAQLLARHRGT